MRLRVIRSWIRGNATLGTMMMYGDHGWEPVCATLEDVPRDVKIKHETCIPEGTYKIKKREVLSGMTSKYRKRFGQIFDFHLELQDVPNYEYVYIHAGNTADHTSGCILVGDKHTTVDDNGFVTNSRNTFERVYKLVSDALEDGQEVTIEVVQEFTAAG